MPEKGYIEMSEKVLLSALRLYYHWCQGTLGIIAHTDSGEIARDAFESACEEIINANERDKANENPQR